MPDIVLKVVSLDAALPAQTFARSFDANGGTIGRDDSNTLALPDKHRRVSRLHATVSFPGGVATITNSSMSLPIAVGEHQLDFGESMPIIHGALVEIGPYVLQAHSLSLDASALAEQLPAAVKPVLPVAGFVAVRHSGMTVVLPPLVAAPSVPSETSVALTAERRGLQPLVEPQPASGSLRTPSIDSRFQSASDGSTDANSVAAAASAASAASAAAAAPDSLTEAFLRGAGLNASALPDGLTPEIMTTIGRLLRSATAGTIDMLAARAATKREVQASVTIISERANNPLKFLPNADAALLQLLGKKMPGFMRADVAMKDAFEDLRAHEIGVIAGTRAALTEVLGKFDPAVLGDKLTKESVLESLMPSARKAKLWDMYLERYLQIRREAEDDFQSIFGRAFVQAYELETARIKGDTGATGGVR